MPIDQLLIEEASSLLVVSHQEHIRRSAESADVREQITMIGCHLKRLHTAHRKPGHGAVIAIGNCAERLSINGISTCVMSSSKAPIRLPASPSGVPNGFPVRLGTTYPARLLGPGLWSIDARLFGWKRVEPAPRKIGYNS